MLFKVWWCVLLVNYVCYIFERYWCVCTRVNVFSSEFHVLALFFFVCLSVFVFACLAGFVCFKESVRSFSFTPRRSCRLLCNVGRNGFCSCKTGERHQQRCRHFAAPGGLLPGATVVLPAAQGWLCADRSVLLPKEAVIFSSFLSKPQSFQSHLLVRVIEIFFITCFWTDFVCVFPHIWMQGTEQVFQVMDFLGINVISLII